MNPLLITPIFELGKSILNRFVPDPEKKAEQELLLLKAVQEGEFKDQELKMGAILAEANSADPWTSRARPTFLYVMYILLLAAIPMGFLHAFQPLLATSVAVGFNAWLAAIPNELYTLFGVGYLGYTGARMWEKKTGVK